MIKMDRDRISLKFLFFTPLDIPANALNEFRIFVKWSYHPNDIKYLNGVNILLAY